MAGKKAGKKRFDPNRLNDVEERALPPSQNMEEAFHTIKEFPGRGLFHRTHRLEKVRQYMTAPNPAWSSALDVLDEIIANSNPWGKRRPQKVNFAHFLAGTCCLQLAEFYKGKNDQQTYNLYQLYASEHFEKITDSFWAVPKFKGITPADAESLMGFFDVDQFAALLKVRPRLRTIVVKSPLLLKYALLAVLETCPRPYKDNFVSYSTQMLFDSEVLPHKVVLRGNSYIRVHSNHTSVEAFMNIYNLLAKHIDEAENLVLSDTDEEEELSRSGTDEEEDLVRSYLATVCFYRKAEHSDADDGVVVRGHSRCVGPEAFQWLAKSIKKAGLKPEEGRFSDRLRMP